MTIDEYNSIKDYSYMEYIDYLNNKYGHLKYPYGSSKNKRSLDGLFIHHIGEDVIPSLSSAENKKLYPEYQIPSMLVYCNFIEHLFLHILIGEKTGNISNLGLDGPKGFIIPQLIKYFRGGDKNANINPSYYSVIENSYDVFKILLARYNAIVRETDFCEPYNQTAYKQVSDFLNTLGRSLLVLGTGLGKTTTALKYITENNYSALAICPNDTVKRVWINSGVDAITYSSFYKSYKVRDMSVYDIVIVDEVHHTGFDEEQNKGAITWGKPIKELLLSNKVKVLGLTATPERTDNNRLAGGLFDDCTVYGKTIEDAIEEGIIHPFSYITSIYDTKGILNEVKSLTNSIDKDDETCKKLIGELNLSINNTPTVRDILHKYMPNGNRKGIIYVSEIDDVEYAMDIFKSVYPQEEFRTINSSMKREDIEENRKWFKNTSSGYLIVVDMISEGFHDKSVNTIIFFRKTKSYILYNQQLGRIITLAKYDNPNAVVFDFVNNIDNVKPYDREINYPSEKKSILTSLKNTQAAKSGQIIVADETRNIVDSLRKLKEYIDDSWEDWEDALLKEHQYDTYNDLSKLLYRKSYISIRNRKKKLGLFIPHHEYSDDEIKILQEYYPSEGSKCHKHLPGRSKGSVISWANKLGIEYIGDRWTADEDKIIERYYPTEGADCCVRLNRERSAVMARASKLGVKYDSYSWTDEEISILRKFYPTEGSTIRNRLPNRTDNAISYMALKLKIYSESKNCPRNNKWTTEEDALITQYYISEKKSICSRLPNREWESIRQRASALGVKLPLKQIICVETTNKYLLNDVCTVFNFSKTKLYKALKDPSKTAGGYHWKYVEDESEK